MMPPVIEEKECIRCDKCVDACSEDVFFGSKRKEVPVISYPKECWHCNVCVAECPKGAIQLRTPLPMMMVYK